MTNNRKLRVAYFFTANKDKVNMTTLYPSHYSQMPMAFAASEYHASLLPPRVVIDLASPSGACIQYTTVYETKVAVTHACRECRLHHKSCSGGRPCSRCAEKGILCENVPRKKTVRKGTKVEAKVVETKEVSPQEQIYIDMYKAMTNSYIKILKKNNKPKPVKQ